MNQSVLLQIQTAITDKLVAASPDSNISIYSRTKGDTESDILNALSSLSQGIAIMSARCEKISANLVHNIVFERITIEVHTVSGIALGASYDAFQLAEWTVKTLSNYKIPTLDALCYPESITPCAITDDSGNSIDSANGAIVTFVLTNVPMPR